ncbi:MAG TPA: M28 family peptidase [Thermoleophilaceae bacterium]
MSDGGAPGVAAESAPSASPRAAPGEAGARELIETLARLERRPCSPGEREAAEWIAARLERAGCERVDLEEEVAYGLYAPTLTALGLLGALASLLCIAGRRVAASAISIAGLVTVVDEAQNGPRLVRRALYPARTTTNVVARIGPDDAPRTVVVLAHHDAHQTGRLYDQSLLMAAHRHAPGLLARMKTSLPQWWVGCSGAVLTLVAVATRRRRHAAAGAVLNLVGAAAMGEVARNPVSPGANDNLSGVAGLVTLAELLRERPLPGLRVLLVSCGAEEALQEGIRAFMARHGNELDPARTAFVNLETVGSPRLIMLEGEGPIWMEDYAEPSFRDLVARCAEAEGIELERGFRARASTDSVIPSRAGHPTATITSITAWGALANYHLPTDTAANVDHDSVQRAARLAYATAAAFRA